MTIYLEKDTKDELPIAYEQAAQKVIQEILSYYCCPYEASVSLYLVDEEEIRTANRDMRKIDQVTDVLSFPNIPFEREADFSFLEAGTDHYAYFDPDTEELILGEIMICQKKLMEQAKEYGHSILREYAFLITHSMLHLLGYDHMEDEQRERMEEAQRLILEKLAILR